MLWLSSKMSINGIEHHILNKFTKFLSIFLRILLIDYACSAAILLTTVIVVNMFSSEYFYVAPIYLPGVPIDTASGFVLHMIQHCSSMVHGFTTYAFFDGLNVLLVLHVLLMTNILREKVRIISEMAAEKQPSQQQLFESIKELIFLERELRS